MPEYLNPIRNWNINFTVILLVEVASRDTVSTSRFKCDFTRRQRILRTQSKNKHYLQEISILALKFRSFFRSYLLKMTSPSNAGKRKQSVDPPVSPPPLRRKVQSTTTRTRSLSHIYLKPFNYFIENAVASFFTPTSQKPPEKIIWQERAPNDDTPSTLLVGKYEPSDTLSDVQTSGKRRKVAAFDFVSGSHTLTIMGFRDF
jgi:hypothetical protein